MLLYWLQLVLAVAHSLQQLWTLSTGPPKLYSQCKTALLTDPSTITASHYLHQWVCLYLCIKGDNTLLCLSQAILKLRAILYHCMRLLCFCLQWIAVHLQQWIDLFVLWAEDMQLALITIWFTSVVVLATPTALLHVIVEFACSASLQCC